MSGNQTLVERFKNLSPAVRIGSVAGLVFFVVVMVLILKPSSGDRRANRVNVNTPLTKANMLTPRAQDRSVEQLSGEVTQQQRSIERIEKTLDRQSEDTRLLLGRLDEAMTQIKLGSGSGELNTELLENLRELQERVDSLEFNPRATDAISTVSDLSPEYDYPSFQEQEPAVVEPPKIIVVGGNNNSGKTEIREREVVPYITANAMFEGQLLNGMDAPTDQSARDTPVPAVIRIKSEAILPNLFNVPNVQECFISVAGYGDMSDERAKMRTEILSCVVPSKIPGAAPRIVEAKVDGYVVGEDGRVGMRGRLVSKQGQLIAKTLLAGVFSGIGDALKPRSIDSLDLSPGSRVDTQRWDPQTVGESGLAQGLSDSARSVSQFYLKLADQMMPIVEIDAGRKVTVVLLKGVELK